jgi:CRP/FNR family transcriptional regulator, cyclic AMP receptor protein
VTDTMKRHAKTFAAGTVLFVEGDEGQLMYVIQSGRIKITRKVGAKETLLAYIPAGEFFGEMSIINAKPRSATATVVEDSTLLVIDGRTFEAMIRGNSEIAVRMIKRLAARLDRNNQQIELLLHRDPNHRVVQFLRQTAEKHGQPCSTGTAVPLNLEGLSQQVGLMSQEVVQVVDRLERARLLSRSEDGSFIVSEVGKLGEFLEFLEMTERYGEG